MPVVNLTTRFVETAKPSGGRQTDFFDDVVKGLCLCASSGGARTWFLHYTKPQDGKRARLKLGSHPELGLASARQKARDARAKIGEGIDPITEKRAHAASQTVRTLIDNYIARHAAQKRSGNEIARRLHKNVADVIGDLKLFTLHRRDITRCIDKVKDRGAAVEANRLFEDIRAMVRWGRARGDLDENLVEGMRRPSEPVIRERVLSAEELRIFWQKLPEAFMQEGTRRILRLCLLLGQRVGEISGMTRGELSLTDRVWCLPPERSKNKRAHEIPVSHQAAAILGHQLAEVPEDCPWVFPAPSGEAPVTNFAVAKAIQRSLDVFGLEPFTAHDLRRSFSTHAEEIGISPFIVGHILNHVSETRSTITSKVYARYSYAKEKRDALQLWADRLDAIVVGGAGEVIPLGARGV